MEFKKIKYSEKKGVQLEYIDNNNIFTVQSFDKPDPELYNSLQALSGYVLSVCELPEDYLGRIETTGIALSRCEDKSSVTIIATMDLLKMDKRKLNLITPHIEYSGMKTQPAIEHIIKQAQSFLDGKREQVDLFDGEKKDE